MWVKPQEKHKDGKTYLARTPWDKMPFKIRFNPEFETFCKAEKQHVLIAVSEIWEE